MPVVPVKNKVTTQKIGHIISFVRDGAKIGTDGTTTASILVAPAENDQSWASMGDISDYTSSQATSDDPLKSFNRETNAWQNNQNKSIDSYSGKFSAAELNSLYWQLYSGAKAAVVATTPFVPDINNEPVRVWLKIEGMNNTGEVYTKIIFCNISLDGDVTLDANIIKPKYAYDTLLSNAATMTLSPLVVETSV